VRRYISLCVLSAVLACCTYMRRSEDGAVPIRHEQIIAFVETVGTCLYHDISIPEEMFMRYVGIA